MPTPDNREIVSVYQQAVFLPDQGEPNPLVDPVIEWLVSRTSLLDSQSHAARAGL